MLRIHAPFASRSHPLVSGLALCARLMKCRHTVVFHSSPQPLLVEEKGKGREQTLKGMAANIALELEGGPRLLSPSLTTAVLALERVNRDGVRVDDSVLTSVSEWEAKGSAVTDAFDSLTLAISIQHYVGVMAANQRLCEAMEDLNVAVGDSGKLNSDLKEDRLLPHMPIFPLVDFFANDARMPLSPYMSVHALSMNMPMEMRKAHAIVRSSAAAAQPASGRKSPDTIFTNVVPEAFAFIRKIQGGGEPDANKATVLEESATRSRGSIGAHNHSVYRKPGFAPKQRRDF